MRLGIYIMGFFIFGLAGVFYVYAHKIAEKRLRQTFANREIIRFDEWFAKYYDSVELHKSLVKDVLTIIANEIKIAPTQIRPDDRFDREFTSPVKYRFLLIDDSVVTALEKILEKYANSGWKFPKNCETVDDLIRRLASTVSS